MAPDSNTDEATWAVIQSGAHRIPVPTSPLRAGASWLDELALHVDRARQDGGGEIGVRVGAGRGFVHVTDAGIAWVSAGAGGDRLSSVITSRTGIPRAALRDVYRRCVARGANFAEALIEEGIVDRETVRAALIEHSARQLERLDAAVPEALETYAGSRAYASSLAFSLDELRAAMGRLPDTSSESSPTKFVATNDSRSEIHKTREVDMANIKQSLDEVLQIDGAIAAALVDWESGLTLGTIGGGGIDIDLAASGNTSVVKAKMAVMRALGISGGIEDILITLQSQYHLIRPLTKTPQLFLYVAIDKQRGNLGMARHRLRQIEEALTI